MNHKQYTTERRKAKEEEEIKMRLLELRSRTIKKYPAGYEDRIICTF